MRGMGGGRIGWGLAWQGTVALRAWKDSWVRHHWEHSLRTGILFGNHDCRDDAYINTSTTDWWGAYLGQITGKNGKGV
jgi:hypothetical protein